MDAPFMAGDPGRDHEIVLSSSERVDVGVAATGKRDRSFLDHVVLKASVQLWGIETAAHRAPPLRI